MAAGRHTTRPAGGRTEYTGSESYKQTVERLRDEFANLPAHARKSKLEDVRRALASQPRHSTPSYLDLLAADVYGIDL